MKKYLMLSFLFLLVAYPVVAKSANSNSATQAQGQNQVVSTTTPVQTQNRVQTRDSSVSPTGQQVQNRNEVQTQNQSEDQQLQVKTKKTQNLNQEVDTSLEKVSTQVQELIDTVGVKSNIGQQVKEIAQNQQKNQEKIKSAYYELKNRGQLIRLFVGSDKKMTQALELMNEENRLTIEKLEGMKNLTNNQTELAQLQDTIGILLTQNGYLEEKIATEKQANGLFGWFTRLFTRE